jgi:wyosine [tRNA(Phe)-imidazoG37] synthetase (radical SAM superfamily)
MFVFDIDFYMRCNELKKELARGEIKDRQYIIDRLEEFRSKKPVVYNIETTNACNMKCKMCPRTTMMTRKVETMDRVLFRNLVDQIEPHAPKLWREWESFIQREYGIPKNAMSENHFFLYIIPRVMQLHGYGDPLLDKNMSEYVGLLTSRGIPSYFSCNPANINVEKTIEMFKSGLDYIKYSIESVEDESHKQIRGAASNFTESYRKIVQLLEIKEKMNYKTTIIITMIDLNRQTQEEDFMLLRRAFEGLDVYIYLKSEDQQWYRQDFHDTKSIHWSEFCKHPWMSMTIKSNGEAAMCMEDFDNEIILGDARKETLLSIWNGERYRRFRLDHINLTKGIKCSERCDMKMVGDFLPH